MWKRHTHKHTKGSNATQKGIYLAKVGGGGRKITVAPFCHGGPCFFFELVPAPRVLCAAKREESESVRFDKVTVR